MNRLHLDIEGMSCGHCVGAVKRSIEALDGVSVDSVKIGGADLTFDASKISPEAIVDVVQEAGYTARVGDAIAR